MSETPVQNPKDQSPLRAAGIVLATLAVAGTGAFLWRQAGKPAQGASGATIVAEAAPCPTARPLPPWAPPGINYCTENRFYVRRCETSPWVQMYQAKPGTTAQGCSAHTWIVYASDGFAYPIIDQGTGGKGYPKPPVTAPEALSVWTQCFLNHVPPANGYNCNQPAPSGTLVYNPVKLSSVPEPWRTTFSTMYGCCGSVTPSPSLTPTQPVTTPTHGPLPTCTPCGCAPYGSQP